MVKIKKPLNYITYSVSLIGAGPLFIWLNLPAQIFLPIALIFGFYSEQKKRYIINSRTATVLSVVFFLFYASHLSLENIVIPVVNMLVLLLSMHLITEKNSRKYLQIFVLSLFCLASSSVFSISVSFFPALILLVFGVTIGLVLLTFYTKEPGRSIPAQQLYTILKTATILPVVSLLLMFIFFIILPRTEHPLWNFLSPAASAISGFSEEVQPGSIASNVAVKTLAFRAQCRELPPEMLYWRGTVLNTLNNTVWQRADFPEEHTQVLGGETVRYTIYLPAKNDRFLFTLDHPLSLSGIRHDTNSDSVFLASKPLQKKTGFQVISKVGGEFTVLKPVKRSFYLEIPDNLSPQLQEVAETVRQGSHSPQETIGLLKNFFREQNLSYATDDLPGPQAPIDEFLFTKKRGYCEFFASSFALLLRMSEVPSRLVGGYLGGSYNNLGGYYLITENMAHVWVEALVDDRWIRIDPTQLAQNPSATPLGGQRPRLSLLRRTVDAIDYYWTQAVITYDFQKQISLIQHTGKGLQSFRRDWKQTVKRWYPVLWIILSAIVIWQITRWKRTSREERIFKRYLRAVRRRYKMKSIPPNLGIYELATHLQDPVCKEFAHIFGSALYSEHPLTKEEYQRLLTLIHILEKEKKPHTSQH
jgi:protein-glutamine gamma-glutamyltransferase